MAILIASPAKFLGIQPTQNPKYATLKFTLPERFRGAILTPQQIEESNCRITIESSEIPSYQSMQVGRVYEIQLTIEVSKGNERYAPGLQFSLVRIGSDVTDRKPASQPA